MSSSINKPVIVVFAALALVTAHTQLTLKQMALRLSGVRQGEVYKVMDLEHYYDSTPRFDKNRLRLPEAINVHELAVLHDTHATFLAGELVDTRIVFESASFDVIDNTATHILVKVDDISEVDKALTNSRRYLAGFAEKSPLVRLALAVPSVNATVSDAFLGILFLLLLYSSLKSKQPLERYRPVIPAIVFIAVSVVSLIPSLRPFDGSMTQPRIRSGMIECVQYIEILIIGFWCFRELLADAGNRRRFVTLTVFMTGLVVFIGIAEYVAVFGGWTLRGLLDVHAIDATFGLRFNAARAWSPGSESSKTVLALYLSMTLPLVVAVTLSASKRWMKGSAAVIAIGSLCLILHAPLLILSVVASLIVVYCFGNGKATALFMIAVVVVLTAVCLLNPHHGRVLSDSMAYVRTTDTYGLQPMPLKGESFDGMTAVQQKYLERQAALNAVGYSPIVGLGVGNYQNVINNFYENAKVSGHAIVKEPVNLMERDSHSLFMVTAVETGIVGVIALGLFLGIPLLRFRATPPSETNIPVTTIAVIASLGVILLSSCFVSFMVRGVQIIAVAIIAYAWNVSSMTAEETADMPDVCEE